MRAIQMAMNPKVLLGFAGSLIFTGSVIWFTGRATEPAPVVPAQPATVVTEPQEVKPVPPAEPSPQEPVRAKPIEPWPIPKREPRNYRAAAPPVRPAPVVAKAVPAPAVTSPASPAPVVEKPSPVASQAPVTPAPVIPAPAPAPEPVRSEPAPPPARVPATVTIPAGTLLNVRLNETISTERNSAGDAFFGELDQELVVNGFVIAEKGARVEGKIVSATPAGRVKGVSQISLELLRMKTSDGQLVEIRTAAFEKQGDTSRKEDAMKVGTGAAIGAAIGAIAGRGRGAAIGAAAGSAAGGGLVLATRGKPAELGVETRISFRLEQPVTLTEKIK
ncbi:MAG: hypothetical protein K2X35_24290 [Bryobacteraceae bacterium]|nr:hypothetical protein [Bryobacteraceae bacterium]